MIISKNRINRKIHDDKLDCSERVLKIRLELLVSLRLNKFSYNTNTLIRFNYLYSNKNKYFLGSANFNIVLTDYLDKSANHLCHQTQYTCR